MAESIDFATVFEELTRIARVSVSSGNGWQAMCAYASAQVGIKIAESIARADLDGDSDQVRRRLNEIISDQPLPPDIDTLLFGLFDAASSDDGISSSGYYVAGVRGFDPEDADSLCHPAWWPDGRYLKSEVLDTIVTASKSSRDPEQHTMLDYALRFGAAALISRLAAQELPHRVVVAFDEGDFAEIVPLRRTQMK